MAVAVLTLPPLARASDPGSPPSKAAAGDQTASGSATASQTNAGNSNASENGGNPGGVSQSNSANAGAKGQAKANVDQGEPTSTASSANPGEDAANAQGADEGDTGQKTSSQAAQADASATQSNPSNSNVSAASGAPGNSGGVSQTNSSDADATAAAATDADTAAPSQTAGATASAGQEDASNTNVSVRVDSAGSDGPVDQSNLASASAQATSDSDQSVATAQAEQTNPTNTNVSVRVFSPGDSGPVSQTNTASATADGIGTGDAAANQTGAANTNISIRVESPGSDGAVTQTSTFTTGSGASVSASNDGVNTNLAIVVDGTGLADPSALVAPGYVVVWNWTWTWNSNAGPGSSQTIAQNANSWTWTWDGSAPSATAPSITIVPADPGVDAETGRLNWSWMWGGAAPDWTWPQQTIKLDCACIWNWTWNWTWNGPMQTIDVSAPQASLGNAGSAAVDQQNTVSAEANAQASWTLTQKATAGTSNASGFVGQLASADQEADAEAYASQDTVLNTLANENGAQANVVTAHAEGIADAWATQTVAQGGGVTPPANLEGTPASLGTLADSSSQWAGQQVAIEQTAASSAQAQQTNAGNGKGHSKNDARSRAGSKVEDTNRQDIVQTGSTTGGTQTQWAGQLVVVAQDGQSQSHVVQTGGHEDAEATSSSSANATAATSQSSEQVASGSAGSRSQTAEQLLGVDQTAAATALTVDGAYGAPSGEASSVATATNRTLVVQVATQQLVGSGGIDDQESNQLTLVVQSAESSSTSYGGKAGDAIVVNCSTVAQSSGQGINVPASAATPDLSSLCAPPIEPVVATPADASRDTFPRAVDTAAFVGRDLTPPWAPDQPDQRVPHGSWAPKPHASTSHGESTRLETRTPRLALPPSAYGVLGARSAFTQVSAPTVIASPSGHAPSVVDDSQTGPPPHWLGSLLTGAASSVPFGSAGGGVAATMAAFLLVLVTGWWIVSDQTFRRSGFAPLGLQSPG